MSDRWPATMKRKTAAAYLDMSEAAFVREVVKGRLPCSVMLGGSAHWRKDAIDAALARIAGEADIPDYRQRLLERLRDEAA